MGTVSFYNLAKKVTEAIKRHAELEGCDRTCAQTTGVLLHEDTRHIEQFAIVGTGTIPDKQLYRLKARMKIIPIRLKPRCISSFQCRDIQRGIYGGGLYVTKLGYFAIYGIDEYVGEACLLYGLKSLDIVDERYVNTILELSKNPHQKLIFSTA